MAAMVMAIMAAAATAMRDVALLRWGDTTVVCDVRKLWYVWSMTLVLAPPLNILPALRWHAERIKRCWAH